MYRDFIEAPEHITVNGRDWWLRRLHNWAGEVDLVIVIDDNGDYAAEFATEAEAMAYIKAK